MPVQTINHTGRRRINREDAAIIITDDEGALSFDAFPRLGGYHLPPSALVYIEAYRQSRWMRFGFGTVGNVQPPADRSLTEFDSPDGVLFRVKVVSGARRMGLLLAQADHIRPRRPERQENNCIPLLPVKSEDLDQEVFRVDFDGPETILLVNKSLGDWRQVARDPVFASLVYPAVLRGVLTHVLFIEKHDDSEDLDDWRSRWLCFAKNLPDVGEPPSASEPADRERRDWIDFAAAAFCRQHRMCGKFSQQFLKGDTER